MTVRAPSLAVVPAVAHRRLPRAFLAVLAELNSVSLDFYEDHKVTLLGVRHLARRLARQSAFGPATGNRRLARRSAFGLTLGGRCLARHSVFGRQC